MDSTPLVSVFVITYNAASYIKDTLDSVKRQTYKNIELIISDDCSTDDTIDVCRAWLEENRGNFVRSELVSTPHNMGVAGNCNNAIKATTGVWLKGLSGDDKFLDYTIEEYVKYVCKYPECRICFAKVQIYGDDRELVKKTKEIYEKNIYPYIRSAWNVQYRHILKKLFVPGPSLFFQKSVWKDVGGFDEHYPFFEEYPFAYNVLAARYRIFFVEKELYSYHVRTDSLSHESSGQLWNQRVFNDFWQYFKDVRRIEMLKHGYLLSALQESISLYNRSLQYKSVSKKERVFAKSLFLLSPMFYWNKLKQIALKHDSK